jgi:hypothetical protein
VDDKQRALIEAASVLCPADIEALTQIARFRARPAALEFNKGAPEVASATEYASSLANRALSQVGELQRLGERAAVSPRLGIVERKAAK